MRDLHPWNVSPAEARQLQLELSAQVARRNEAGEVRLVAGADISAPRDGAARGAVVVLTWPELALAEVQTVEQPLAFPYVPGLLSFREAPLVIAAWSKLRLKPNLLLVDGQGLAHPRRFGLACHLGLWLETPAIGCAKSVLVGHFQSPAPEPGAWSPLVADAGPVAKGDRGGCEGEVVGAALRTRPGSAPVYVSVGHRVDLETARDWVMALCRGHRLPEPARLAHLAASGRLKEQLVGRVSQPDRLNETTPIGSGRL